MKFSGGMVPCEMHGRPLSPSDPAHETPSLNFRLDTIAAPCYIRRLSLRPGQQTKHLVHANPRQFLAGLRDLSGELARISLGGQKWPKFRKDLLTGIYVPN
jgi:hypothetical protein